MVYNLWRMCSIFINFINNSLGKQLQCLKKKEFYNKLVKFTLIIIINNKMF